MAPGTTGRALSPGRSLARVFWVELPIRVGRWSPGFGSALTDGQFLLRWSWLAWLMPVAAVVWGGVVEALQVGEVFTTSLLVMIALGGLGLLSFQLGAWSWLGYVAMDLISGRHVGVSMFLFRDDEWWFPAAGVMSAVVEYVLLGVGVLGVPFVVVSARLAVRRSGLAPHIGSAGERLVHGLVAAAGAYVWCQVLISSIRTTFTILGVFIPIEAITPTQQDWPLVVVALVGVVVVRWVVEWVAFTDAALPILKETTQRFGEVVFAAGSGAPGWVRAALHVGFVLVLLGGVIDYWWQIVVTAVVVLAVRWVRVGLGRTRAGGWWSGLSVWPRLVVSVGLCFVVIREVSQAAHPNIFNRSSLARHDFLVPWILVVASYLVVGLATVARPPKTDAEGARSRRPPSRPPPPTLAVSLLVMAGTMVAALLGFAEPVSADDCSSLSDCFGTSTALMIALGVLLIAIGVLLVVTAPVSAPAVAAGGTTLLGVSVSGGTVFVGASVAIPTSALVGGGFAASGAYIAGSEASEFIQDMTTGHTSGGGDVGDPTSGAAVVMAEGRAVPGQWEEGPRPPTPLEAELDQIIEHAWDKHVTQEREFPEIETEDELRELLEEVIDNATEWGYRDDGATYWYDDVTDTVVIKNPPGVGGTTYRPGPGGTG